MMRRPLLCSRLYLLSTLSTSLTSFVSATTPACHLSTLSKMSTATTEYEPGTHSIAYVTAPNDETAKKIGRGLVEKKLAACVNIIPQITSIYEWKDKIEMDSEVLLMIKTKTNILEEMTKFVRENHPYDVCEVITLPIQGGNLPYLQWIGKNVKEN